MKNLLLAAFPLLLFLGCKPVPAPRTYRHVVAVDTTTRRYVVTISRQVGGHVLQNAAGGAVSGGAVSWLLGGSATEGALAGGLLGTAVTGAGQLETTQEERQETTYRVTFDDGSVQTFPHYCPLSVGDSLAVW